MLQREKGTICLYLLFLRECRWTQGQRREAVPYSLERSLWDEKLEGFDQKSVNLCPGRHECKAIQNLKWLYRRCRGVGHSTLKEGGRHIRR